MEDGLTDVDEDVIDLASTIKEGPPMNIIIFCKTEGPVPASALDDHSEIEVTSNSKGIEIKIYF